jgi:hypothetical protein
MIVHDRPRDLARGEFRSFRRTAHCASTLLGEEGTEELLAFGRGIGLRESWLQHRGTEREHIDLFDRAIARAVAAGSEEIEPREFVRRIVQYKRAVYASGSDALVDGMRLFHDARAAGWEPSPRLCPPDGAKLADGWEREAQEHLDRIREGRISAQEAFAFLGRKR